MKHNITLGVTLVLISAFTYALVAAIVKQYSIIIATPVIVFIQTSISLLLLSLIIACRGAAVRQAILKSRNKKLHLLRTASSLSLGYFLYYSLQYIPLVNAVLLINIAPLLAPLLGYFFFKKIIYHRLWLPMLIGLIGVAIVLNPKAKEFNLGALLAFAGAICMAFSPLLTRKAAEQGDNGTTTTFYYLCFATIVSGITSIPFWHTINWHIYAMIALSGLLFFVVQYTITLSLQYAEASLVTTLYYSNVLFAALLGLVIFHHYPSLTTWLGLGLIIISGIGVIQAQRRINKKI